MRDSLINTCGMKMRKLLDKKSEVFAQKYGVRNVELEILLFLYHQDQHHSLEKLNHVIHGKLL